MKIVLTEAARSDVLFKRAIITKQTDHGLVLTCISDGYYVM